MSIPLSSQIESILFYRAEPLSYDELGKLVGVSSDEVKNALHTLQDQLRDRGTQIILTDRDAAIVTHPEMAERITQLRTEELSQELTRPALETLAIILYLKSATKNDIDYIRGVNSQFILRSLLMRGLVDRMPNKEDARRPRYLPTIELLSYLGVGSLEELPHYSEACAKLSELMSNGVVPETIAKKGDTPQSV